MLSGPREIMPPNFAWDSTWISDTRAEPLSQRWDDQFLGMRLRSLLLGQIRFENHENLSAARSHNFTLPWLHIDWVTQLFLHRYGNVLERPSHIPMSVPNWGSESDSIVVPGIRAACCYLFILCNLCVKELSSGARVCYDICTSFWLLVAP